jgi:predicted ArsR family transcriptional regulator
MTDVALDRLAPLADPVRRSLYAFVVAQPDAVDRDTAAAGVGVGRPLAAFHLDRLASAGLLDVEYHRRSGRTGPGAGRPAKFYRRARGLETTVSLPPRRYDDLAVILAEGVGQSAESVRPDAAGHAGNGNSPPRPDAPRDVGPRGAGDRGWSRR